MTGVQTCALPICIAVKEGFGAHARKQEGYARLEAHYGFEAVFCNPASGNEKGLVEGLVGFIRRNVCVPIPQVQSLDELNRMLLTKCRQYAAHQIRGKAASVGVMLTEDKRQMHPLPGYRFETARKIHARVDRYCTVRFDTNNYSVPSDCRAREVTVKATPEVVQILYCGSIIAEHPRCYGKKQNIYRLEHYLKLLEKKGRAICFAQPVTYTIPDVFLNWLTRQELTPRQITELLLRCQEEGCEAVMAHHVPQLPSAEITDTVQAQAVDLRQYDSLYSRKAGIQS